MKRLIKKILCLAIAFCTILFGSSLYHTPNILAASADGNLANASVTEPLARSAEAEAPSEEELPEDPLSEEPDQPLSTYFFVEDEEKTVAVNLGPNGALPADAVLVVRDLKPDNYEQADAYAWADSALQQYCDQHEKTAEEYFVYDIHFEVDDEYMVPDDMMQVSIIYKNDDRDIRRFVDNGALSVLHFDNSTGEDILTDVNAEIYPSEMGTTAITFDLYNHDLYPYVICVLQDYVPEETPEEETSSSVTYEDVQPLIITMDDNTPEEDSEENSDDSFEPEGGDQQEEEAGENQDQEIPQDEKDPENTDQEVSPDEENPENTEQEGDNAGTAGSISDSEADPDQTESGSSLITIDEENDTSDEETSEGSHLIVLFDDETEEEGQVAAAEGTGEEDGEAAATEGSKNSKKSELKQRLLRKEQKAPLPERSCSRICRMEPTGWKKPLSLPDIMD